MRIVDFGCTTTGIFIVTPSLGGLPTKAEESPLPMRQTSPRRTPTRNFMVSGRANRYYTLLKGDLEVIVAKGNLIIPRRNSITGCSFMSYPGQLLLLLLLLYIYSHGSDVIPVVCLLSGHLPLLEIIDRRSFSLKHNLIDCNPKLF